MRKIVERTWRKDDPERCLELPMSERFAVVDPGEEGAGGIFNDTWDVPMTINRLQGWNGALEFADTARTHGVRIAILEEPFVGENVSSGLATSRSFGFAAGALAAACPEIAFVRVYAQSWQGVVIPRDLGDRAARKKAMDEKATQLMEGDSRWFGRSKKEREAVADIIGMALWWRRVRRVR